MNEVKRLVRARKLAEATTLLRRVLDGGTAAPTATSTTNGGIAAALAECAGSTRLAMGHAEGTVGSCLLRMPILPRMELGSSLNPTIAKPEA